MSRESAAQGMRNGIKALALGFAVAGFGMMPAAHAAGNPLQEAVSQGKHLFIHATFGGDGATCETCHRAAGMGPTVVHGHHFPSLANAAAIFPRYNRRAHKVVTIEDQIRGCVARGMKGKPPAYGSKTMNSMVAYLTSLSQGKPVDMGGKPK